MSVYTHLVFCVMIPAVLGLYGITISNPWWWVVIGVYTIGSIISQTMEK